MRSLFGDIVPTSPLLRLIVPLEALFGFMLLTAAVSWVLQIYPALHRRRVLALQLSTMRKARRANPDLDIDSIPADVLAGLADAGVEARNDFTRYGASYYFATSKRMLRWHPRSITPSSSLSRPPTAVSRRPDSPAP